MELIRDLRQAARSLARQPGFTAVAVLALGLGIGSTTAIFSVVQAVLLKPLPFEQPDELMVVRERETRTDRPPEPTSAATLEDWREQSRTFDGLAGWIYWGLALTGAGEPEELSTVRHSANLFALLGVEPALGRGFTADEERPGADRVVVLSDGLWRSRFGAEPSVIGRTIVLDDEPHEIVGVMPPGFRFPDDADVDLWMPLAYRPYELRTRNQRMFHVLGRLAPGVTLEEATAEMRTIASRLAREHPETNANYTVELQPMREAAAGSAREPLFLLLGAVGLVLLIACANVASLFLARVAGRERDIAIRTALGAGRGRVLRYLLAEALLISAGAAFLGLLLAYWGVDAIRAIDPGHLPGWNAIRIDGPVLAFAIGTAALTVVLAGLMPALTGSRARSAEALKQAGARATSAWGAVRLRKALIVTEVGLAIVLLLGAGLLIRSFWRVVDQDPGFRPGNLLAMTLYLPETRYAENERQIGFFEDLLDRLRAAPNVSAVGAVTTLPMSPVGIDHDMPFLIEGTASAIADPRPQADFRITTTDYFRAMGIPLLAGRTFTEHDRAGARNVVVINRTMADRYLEGADPIGRTLRWGGGDGTPAEIVGVVADVRHRGLDSEPRPELYVPHLQLPYSYGTMTFAIRTPDDPLGLAEMARNHVFALDPQLPVTELTTMDRLLARSVAERRFNMALLGTFATLALILAAIGIYSVISYSVALRTREIGVRIALGARGADVVRLVLRDGLRLAAAGALLGTLMALFLTRSLTGLLYGVDPLDPLTFVVVPLGLLAIATAASAVPARRAAGLDPVRALAHDR